MFRLFTKTKNSAFENLSANEFLSRIQNTPDAVVLDVRTPAEFSEGTLPGAINLDIFNASFRDELEKLDRDKTYFVFCRSGSRSAQACQIMNKMGFRKLNNLAGGWLALN